MTYNDIVRRIPSVLSFGFAIIATIVFCTYVGYRLNHIVIGIIVGFLLALAYLFKNILKK